MNPQIENYWNFNCDRVEIAKQARWINSTGRLTPTGKRIARSWWNELSPAAQRVIARVCGLESL